MVNPIPLEQLVNITPLIIFDTCGIEGNSIDLGKYAGNDRPQVLINHYEEARKHAEHIRETLFSTESVYITPRVKKEMLASGVPYKKKIRNSQSIVPFWRAVRETAKVQRALAERFDETGNILQIENPHYNKLMNYYQHIMKKWGLSETDKEIVITGIFLSKNFRTTIVSNDFKHVIKAGKSIADREGISKKFLKLYFQNHEGYFERCR